jgi:hypothetical protein
VSPDPELAAALQSLEYAFGPLQVLGVRPTSPQRRPASPPGPAGPDQPSLFEPEPEPATPPATTDPLAHIPPSRRRREVVRHALALPPTLPTTNR